MFKKILGLSCSVICTSALTFAHTAEATKPNSERNAICILYPNNSNVRGVASFSQENITSPVKIAVVVKGLNPNSKHGIHIHQYGDLTEGCATAGAHFNPEKKNHGGPFDKERHVGDLGNLISDPFGNSYMCFKDEVISLFGEQSVVGRAVVVHQNEDDLGKGNNEESLKTGNAGSRVACGVIGLSKEFKNIPPTEN